MGDQKPLDGSCQTASPFGQVTISTFPSGGSTNAETQAAGEIECRRRGRPRVDAHATAGINEDRVDWRPGHRVERVTVRRPSVTLRTRAAGITWRTRRARITLRTWFGDEVGTLSEYRGLRDDFLLG